jgi:photosystem II stability/assembly factor-like uncharacterized protein
MRVKDARRRYMGAWLFLAIGALFPTFAHAGPGVWTSGGPYGGDIRALAINPTTPATLYAGTNGAGVFKSTDSGGSWAAAGLTNQAVRALAINPASPATLYAAAGGVFKSTDSGSTWIAVGPTNVDVSALAINSSTPSTLYAGTSAGVFKSTDAGGTWAAANTGLTYQNVYALAINLSTPSTLYAGTDGGGVFKSTNSGGTWAATSLTGLSALALAINPATPATVYAGTDVSGVFKSNDAGGTWAAANTGLANPFVSAVHALAISPSTPATVYAGMTGQRGVFTSTDSGGSWAAVNTGLTNTYVLTLAINPTTPTTLYAGTTFGGGIFKTIDSGGTWAAATAGLTNVTVQALAVDPSTPATLYAGTDLGGIFKSTDSGATWAGANTGLPNLGETVTVRALAINPSIPSTLYAGPSSFFGGGVFKSTDSGGTWTVAGLTNPNVLALAINPSTPATLYAGTYNGGVFKSTDSGATWAAANTGLTYNLIVFALAINPATPSTLYAGRQDGVFKSTDSGATWAAANTGLPSLNVLALAINPSTPATLYAGTDRGVFKSTDSGANWATANTGLTNTYVNALAINPSTPATLYAGTDAGVFKSTDAGGTWTAANKGLPQHSVQALALEPTGATTLFAGLSYGSAWQWTPAAEPTSVLGFVPIVLDVVGLAHYTSELQLTNLGVSSTTVKLSYTGSIASGAGDVQETIPAGQQVVYSDAISYLRFRGVPIPASGSQGGTLLLSAPAGGIHATCRTGADTVAPQPTGRSGLAYTDTDPAASSSTTKLYVYGLRASDADRSNLAVYNMGADPVSLKVTLVSGDDARSFEVTAGVPRVLPAYGWYQYSGVFDATGLSSGYAVVERLAGSGPFGAYGVVNDQKTNDGSFIPALSGTQSGSKLTIPVLVETSAFESELILTNRGNATATFTMRYVESLSPEKGLGGTTTVDVAGGRQMIIPKAIDFLRSKQVAIGARGEASYAGSLQVQVNGVGLESVFAGARTSSFSPVGGEFGLFYPAIDSSQEAFDTAFILGLKADVNNRSNVAVINTGADGSGPITLELQVLDGSEGGKAVGQPLSVTLNPGEWAQPPGFFASGGVPNGYVRIRRIAGTAPWYAYGVINDGGQPGQRTGDGAYVPMVK